jgi:hypothetical protein
MLNNMVASFSASNQVGEMMKKTKRTKPKTENHSSDYQATQAPEEPETEV